MPSAALKYLAKRAKISLDKAEHLWAKSKEIVDTEYHLSKDDSSYWALRMGITKRMMGLKEYVTFAEFMREAAVSEKPRYDAIDIGEAVKFIKANCSDSIKWIKKGLGFWRMDRAAVIEQRLFAIADPTLTKRRSQNTSNHYTVLMDTNPYMRHFPKRSRSFIATTDMHYAESFKYADDQHKMMVIPVDGTPIGFVPAYDIWEIDPSPLFGTREVLTDLRNDFERLGISDTIESFQHVDALLKANPNEKLANLTIRDVWPKISDTEIANFLDSLYVAFTKAGFEMYTTKNVSEAVMRDDREVWIGGKCICISESAVQEIAGKL